MASAIAQQVGAQLMGALSQLLPLLGYRLANQLADTVTINAQVLAEQPPAPSLAQLGWHQVPAEVPDVVHLRIRGREGDP